MAIFAASELDRYKGNKNQVLSVDNTSVSYYYCAMIVSINDKETEKIWSGEYSRKFPMEIQRTARRKLIHIHSAINLNDLRVPPGNKLHALEGTRKGQFSIRINDQWRICFKWLEGNAYEVEIVDYH